MKPIADILRNTLSPISELLHLLTLNAIFIILFICQRKIIFNYDFECYAKSLPISKAADRISSLFVLFISNNFLWIFLLMGSLIALHDQPVTSVFIGTIYLILSLLMLQLFLYEKNISKLIVLLLCNSVFVMVKYYVTFEPIQVAVRLFLSCSLLILAFSDLKSILFGNRSHQLNKLKLNLGSVFPVQLAMLRPSSGFLLIKLLISFFLQGLAALFITHLENPNLIYFIILFEYIVICIMGSFSRVFALETKKVNSYFQSLPIPTYYWFLKNQILNLILTTIVLFPGSCFALMNSAFSVWTFFYLILAAIVINAVVYYSNSKQLRNTSLLMYLVALFLYVIQFLIR
ncbi:MAG: hypothetical protein H0U73_12355 [Tatlockia sp.]|nr:hypothetical protein [Tatlockia sp.]